VPIAITAGPDGNLWFVEEFGNKVGKITPAGAVTEYTITTAGSFPFGITAGPDGTLWFTEANTNKVGKITPAGTVTEYAIPSPNSHPQGITAGPDGNLWFVENIGNKVGRITPAGTVTEYTIPTANSQPEGITAGGDGDLWFTESNGNQVGRITPGGTVTEFLVTTGGSQPDGIAAGPDGNLWFAESGGNKVGRISPALSGSVTVAVPGPATQFVVTTTAANPYVAGTAFSVSVTAQDSHGLTAIGFGGIVHFSSSDPRASLPADYTFTAADHGMHTFSGVAFDSAGGQTLTASSPTPIGTVTEFPLANPHSGPAGITAGPDGNVWFTENAGNAVGKITPAGVVAEYVNGTPPTDPRGSRRARTATSGSPKPIATGWPNSTGRTQQRAPPNTRSPLPTASPGGSRRATTATSGSPSSTATRWPRSRRPASSANTRCPGSTTVPWGSRRAPTATSGSC
jgi:streptogramin lyase